MPAAKEGIQAMDVTATAASPRQAAGARRRGRGGAGDDTALQRREAGLPRRGGGHSGLGRPGAHGPREPRRG